MRAFIGIILLFTSVVYAKGKLQNEDFKTLTELTTAGGTAAQLLNDSKVYVTANGINSQLSSAITNGQLGGSGTGINLLQALNPTFESGITSWTASGGTFTHITSGQLFGLGSGQWTPTAAAQTLQSSLVSFPVGSEGKTCLAVFEYNWNGTLGQITADLVDGSGNVLANMTLTPAAGAGARKSYSAQLDCPVSPTQARIRLTSTAASTALKIDQSFIGLFYNDVQVSQAEIFGTLKFPSTAGCQWTSTTTGSFVNFAADNDCSAGLVTGKASPPATKIPAITFATMPPGRYVVNFNFVPGLLTANTDFCYYQLNDGASTGLQSAIYTGAGAPGSNSSQAHAVFDYTTTQTNKTIQLQAQVFGTNTCLVTANAAQNEALFTVHYYPLNPNNAITLETSGWNVQAIHGGANFTMSTGAVGSYTEMTNAGITLISLGSLTAKNACSGTNPATGLTCAAGSESSGISFNSPTNGYMYVCATGSHQYRIAGNSAINTTFTIERNTNSTQTLIGSQPAFSTSASNTDASVTQDDKSHPVQVCGVMPYVAGENTLRVKYIQSVTGTVTTNVFGNVSWSVVDISNQMPAPIFTDLQNSLRNRLNMQGAVNQYNAFDATVNGSGVVTSSTGGVSGSVKNGTGDYSVNLTSGFGTEMYCSCTASQSPGYYCHLISSGGNAVRVQLRTDASAVVDTNVHIKCSGR